MERRPLKRYLQISLRFFLGMICEKTSARLAPTKEQEATEQRNGSFGESLPWWRRAGRQASSGCGRACVEEDAVAARVGGTEKDPRARVGCSFYIAPVV
jgi:hypothetical protein